MNRACLALVLIAACDQTRTLGSRWVRSETIDAAKGGTVEVPAGSGDPLAGSALRLDPGTLPANATVTLEQGASPLSTQAPAAGPVAVWGPQALALARPARLSLPFQLSAGQAAADLMVVSRDANGTLTKIDHALLTVDAAAGLVHFQASHLGEFQAATVSTVPPCDIEGCACTLDEQCLAPLVCHEGRCKNEDRDGGSGDGGRR